MNWRVQGLIHSLPLIFIRPRRFFNYMQMKKASHTIFWQQPKWITNHTLESTDRVRLPLRETSLLCTVKLKEEHIMLSKTSGLWELQAQKPCSNPNHMPSPRKWGSVSFGDGKKHFKVCKADNSPWEMDEPWNVFCLQIIVQMLCKAFSLAK